VGVRFCHPALEVLAEMKGIYLPVLWLFGRSSEGARDKVLVDSLQEQELEGLVTLSSGAAGRLKQQMRAVYVQDVSDCSQHKESR
jgi:hypothetical protein